MTSNDLVLPGGSLEIYRNWWQGLELYFLERSILGTALLYKGPSAILMFLGSPWPQWGSRVYPLRTPWLPFQFGTQSHPVSSEGEVSGGVPACLHPVEVCFKPKATSCLHQQVLKRSKARAGEFRGQELRMAIQPPCHGRVEA